MSQAEAEENPLCQENDGSHKTSRKAQNHYRMMKLTYEEAHVKLFFLFLIFNLSNILNLLTAIHEEYRQAMA